MIKETRSPKKNTYQVLVKRTDNQDRSWLELVEVEAFVDESVPPGQLLH
jgi:hypothetical protein